MTNRTRSIPTGLLMEFRCFSSTESLFFIACCHRHTSHIAIETIFLPQLLRVFTNTSVTFVWIQHIVCTVMKWKMAYNAVLGAISKENVHKHIWFWCIWILKKENFYSIQYYFKFSYIINNKHQIKWISDGENFTIFKNQKKYLYNYNFLELATHVPVIYVILSNLFSRKTYRSDREDKRIILK